MSKHEEKTNVYVFRIAKNKSVPVIFFFEIR